MPERPTLRSATIYQTSDGWFVAEIDTLPDGKSKVETTGPMEKYTAQDVLATWYDDQVFLKGL